MSSNSSLELEYKIKADPHFDFIKDETELESEIRNHVAKIKSFSMEVSGRNKMTNICTALIQVIK